MTAGTVYWSSGALKNEDQSLFIVHTRIVFAIHIFTSTANAGMIVIDNGPDSAKLFSDNRKNVMEGACTGGYCSRSPPVLTQSGIFQLHSDKSGVFRVPDDERAYAHMREFGKGCECNQEQHVDYVDRVGNESWKEHAAEPEYFNSKTGNSCGEYCVEEDPVEVVMILGSRSSCPSVVEH